MQFIAVIDATIRIKCPVCSSELEPVMDQVWSERLQALSPPTERLQDHRVRIMRHPTDDRCPWSNQKFRVDCFSGYAEPWPEIEGKEAQDRANLPLTP